MDTFDKFVCVLIIAFVSSLTTYMITSAHYTNEIMKHNAGEYVLVGKGPYVEFKWNDELRPEIWNQVERKQQ